MSNEPTNPTWREQLTLATLCGAISGAVRAIVTWLLRH